MDYEIRQEQKRKIAGFHMVGPWEHTVKQGFEQLMTWVDRQRIVPVEWIAVYYDNPDVVPAEKLRCDTAAIPWCPWQRISSCRTIAKA